LLSIRIANRSFEAVAKFKYLGTILTDQNCIYEEIKTRINSRNACYHSFKSLLLSSRLLFRNVRVKIHRIILLPVVLYGCETWSLTLREEHRLKMFENKVLRRISGPKRDEVTGEWRKLHNEVFLILYSSPNIIRQMKSRRMWWAGHVARMRGERNVQGFGGKVYFSKMKVSLSNHQSVCLSMCLSVCPLLIILSRLVDLHDIW
jgi:hypothetical protein